jgi:ubiquinone/menaquinone biosynthesis C-methylase UbiE
LKYLVNQKEFWKQRIDDAYELRQSVYWTLPQDWDEINLAHMEVIQKFCKGKILDAGCAYGRASEWIKDYVGVDISPDFIKLAKQRYPDREFILCDLKEMPFKTQDFDWAVCISIKAMLEREVKGEWSKVLKELKRVAKKILILEYSSKGKYEIISSVSKGISKSTLA